MTQHMKPQITPLEGAVQHYDWGGKSFIPKLIGATNEALQPFAELWMGDHAGAPAKAILPEGAMSLHQLFEVAPEWLGQSIVEQFGARLPYLFKILDVHSMLSIQAHPNKAEAEKGFREENEAGVPLKAAHRNFKDDNHKPEIMVALSDFWLLHGFRSTEEIEQIISETAEFESLKAIWQTEGLRALYRYIMEMPQAQVDALLQPLAERLEKEMPANKNQPDYWALKAMKSFQPSSGRYDRGIFSIYLFNLVYIPEGKGIFQDAGIPHAYLEGVNVELMANSDNVFRGGLTPKHIDVPLLLEHLDFSPVVPRVFGGFERSKTEKVFLTPAPDFELSCIELDKGQLHESLSARGPHTLIVLEGEVLANNTQPFRRGDCFLVPEGLSYTIASEAPAVLYKAALPANY